jgi:hypothetical protein
MNQQPNLFLSILRDCNPRARFDAWQRDGGALLGNRNIGCGINSLTFLEVFTRQQGENLVRVINQRGTTFQEMMNYVFNSNGGNPQFERRFDITNVERTQSLIDFLQDDNTLPRGSCTIAKMLRYDDNISPRRMLSRFNGNALTSGHSIIFSKNDQGVLSAIDPQQNSYRQSDDAIAAFNAWSRHYYQSVCLMFSQQPLEPSVPMVVDDDDFNILLSRLIVPMDVVSDIDETANGTEPMNVDGGMGKINKKLRIKNKIKTNKIRKIKNKKMRKTRTNSRNTRRRKHYLSALSTRNPGKL